MGKKSRREDFKSVSNSSTCHQVGCPHLPRVLRRKLGEPSWSGHHKGLGLTCGQERTLTSPLRNPPTSRNFSCALDGSSFDTEDEWVAMLNCAAPRSKFLLIILSISLSRCSLRLTFKSTEREFKALGTGCLSPTQTRNQQSVTKPRDTKTCLLPKKLSR